MMACVDVARRELVQVEFDDVVPVLPAKSMTHNKSFLDRLQRVEKHLRKNKLKLTLTQRLGNAADEDEVHCRSPLWPQLFLVLTPGLYANGLVMTRFF